MRQWTLGAAGVTRRGRTLSSPGDDPAPPAPRVDPRNALVVKK
jgi:hypothetical protein